MVQLTTLFQHYHLQYFEEKRCELIRELRENPDYDHLLHDHAELFLYVMGKQPKMHNFPVYAFLGYHSEIYHMHV